MIVFNLTTKDGEVINKIESSDKDGAVDYFSDLKKLKPSQLLEIYNVVRHVNKSVS